jgi:hypothetical protein
MLSTCKKEELEDTKGVIRIRKLKNRQQNVAHIVFKVLLHINTMNG